MSIKWMTQVWASAEPSHPTDRLMLLALADNANDERIESAMDLSATPEKRIANAGWHFG